MNWLLDELEQGGNNDSYQDDAISLTDKERAEIIAQNQLDAEEEYEYSSTPNWLLLEWF